MSELPDGWAIQPLGELCDLENGDRGKNYPSKSVLVEEGVPFINAGHLNSGRVDMSKMNFIPEERFEILRGGKIRKGDLLFCLRGSLGKSALITNLDKGAVASSLVIVRPRGAVTPEFMSHYFDAPIAKHMISLYDNGSAQPNLSGADLKKFEVPLPPLPEQRRIVARIEELFSRLDAGVAALRHAKAQLQRYRQSVLAAAVTGQLTQAWREQHPDTEPAEELLERILKLRPSEWTGRGKYKTPDPPDTEGLPDLPKTWSWTNFETLANAEKHALKAGPFGSALKKEFYGPSGYKIYGQEQVIKDDPYFGDYYIDEERFQSLKSCETKPGDFLISLVGTIGRTMIVPEDAEPGIINPRLVKMSIDRRLVDPRLLKIYLGSSRVKAFFKIVSHGGTMDVLNLTTLKALPIPVPPLAELPRILDEVEARTSAIDHLEAEIDRQIKRSNRLRQSVLSTAFSGKLNTHNRS